MKMELIDGGGVPDCVEITENDGKVRRLNLSPAEYILLGLMIGLQEEIEELTEKIK